MDLKDALVKFDLNSENHALGTDKDSTHSYVTKFYDGLFQVIPPVNILIEIGIWKGASCVLWKKDFLRQG